MNIAGIFGIVILISLIVFIVLRLKKNKEIMEEGVIPVVKTQPKEEKPVISKSLADNEMILTENKQNAEYAAIALALHLYFNDNIHDEESNVITIKRIQRRYSPWSSKIYSINNYLPR